MCVQSSATTSTTKKKQAIKSNITNLLSMGQILEHLFNKIFGAAINIGDCPCGVVLSDRQVLRVTINSA